jgi:hypothetical protein
MTDILSFYPYTHQMQPYTTDDEYRNCLLQLTTLENWTSFTENCCVDSMQPIYTLISVKYRYCTTNSLCVTILMSYDYLLLFHQCMQRYCLQKLEKKEQPFSFSQEECFQLLLAKINHS